MVLDPIDELFERTLAADYEDVPAWEAVAQLRLIGNRRVFERAAEWCRSESSLKRARGADVLAQIGRTTDHPQNNFSDECFSIVSALAQIEDDPVALSSAISALGHIGNLLAIPQVVEHQNHESASVRLAVACALGGFDDPKAMKALVTLTRDSDKDVRDWATFGQGVIGTGDSSEIREALFERITDPDADVREEAIVGLAKRNDRRIVPVLIAELDQSEITRRQKEAAEHLLGQANCQIHWESRDYVKALNEKFAP